MKRVCAAMLSTMMLLCGLVRQANAEQYLNGSSAPSGLHGVREFFKSGKFRVPPNITGVLVVMWAGGGGGGAGYASGNTCFTGGGGGGSAWTKHVLAVVPGAKLSIVVGLGGTASTNGNGGAGGDSQIVENSKVLVYAGGGQGGTAASSSGNGTRGAGGSADPKAMISHPPSAQDNMYGFPYDSGLLPDDVGGDPQTLSIGGSGGYPCGNVPPTNGGPGYVSLEW